jgi:VWFA-related protein
MSEACAQQAPTIRIPVRLVSVPTLVVSKDGKYIPGLSAADFRVTDNGRTQTLTLDSDVLPVSLAVAVQTNRDVRGYLGIIAKTGALLDNSLAAPRGETALVTYGDEIRIGKQFTSGDLQAALRALSPSGDKAKMIDAGIRGSELLEQRPGSHSRILLFIGQPVDSGSQGTIKTLEQVAEREDVQIYALTLPVLGTAFISDSFSLEGFGSQWYKGGYKASVDLTNAVPALRRASQVRRHADPFSILTAATGGIQLHFRKQKQLEDAIIGLGEALRSRYRLSYRPDRSEPGFHKIVVNVDRPDAIVYARPGYGIADESPDSRK